MTLQSRSGLEPWNFTAPHVEIRPANAGHGDPDQHLLSTGLGHRVFPNFHSLSARDRNRSASVHSVLRDCLSVRLELFGSATLPSTENSRGDRVALNLQRSAGNHPTARAAKDIGERRILRVAQRAVDL